MITYLFNLFGHDRVAYFLFKKAPIGALNKLVMMYLGNLTSGDPRLRKYIVSEITIEQIVDSMQDSEEHGQKDKKCQMVL